MAEKARTVPGARGRGPTPQLEHPMQTLGRVLGFVEQAIAGDFTGGLPYLTTFITAVWTAYGASVSFYQNKSAKENVKKIEAAMAANPDPDSD